MPSKARSTSTVPVAGWCPTSRRAGTTASVFFGPETRISGGSFSHNGQLGIAGTGEGSTLDGVEIAYNNYAGYNSGWEAGGTKFARTRNLVVGIHASTTTPAPACGPDIDNIGRRHGRSDLLDQEATQAEQGARRRENSHSG